MKQSKENIDKVRALTMDELAKWAKAVNLNDYEWARLAGVDRTQVTRLRNKKVLPGYHILCALSVSAAVNLPDDKIAKGIKKIEKAEIADEIARLKKKLKE